ncbi:MAG: DNA primase [Halieaceae bacterium]|nr:DNA primase [Halieaceae bacterium]
MAGRIPQTFIDDLIDRVDIVEIIDRRVKLKKTGKNYSARCPFHDEKTPSFSVNQEKQFYYCFGCGAGGNALGFLMDYDNTGFPETVETLATSVGLEVPREQTRPGAPQEEQSNRELYAVMEQVEQFYRQALRNHAKATGAVNYLKERGLSGIIAKQFGLGYAPPGWDNLLTALGSSDGQRALLLKSGMLVQNEAGKIYDRFRDRVMFPIRDQRGRVIAFGGRVLGDDKPKYLNSPETGIFHKGRELYGLYEAKQSNRKLERILVVEGYMDVIALAQYDINYATATLGTATSKNHLERIYRLCPEVIFCFDGDEAGRKAALRALEATLPCMEDGRQARFLFLPEGEDPDTVVRGGGTAHFEQLQSEAMALEVFLFETVATGIDTDSMDGRARLSKRALPYIRQLPQGIYRQLMFQSLAERTGLEVATLMQLEAPPPPPQPQEVPVDEDFENLPGHQSQPRQRTLRREIMGGYASNAHAAIALLLHQPDIARLADPAQLDELEGEDIGLLRELLDLRRRRPESNTAMLLGHWYDTPEGDLLSKLAGQERLIPRDGIEQQFLDTITALSQLPHRAKLEAQVDKLKLTNYAEVSELEKQRLRELLQQKQQRDAQRNKNQN